MKAVDIESMDHIHTFVVVMKLLEHHVGMFKHQLAPHGNSILHYNIYPI